MKKVLFCLLAIGVLGTANLVQALTLEDVYDARQLRCGVTTGKIGFSAPDTQNNWHGMEIELCRALALMIFGETDDDRVQFVPLTSGERIDALTSGKVHVLAAQQKWSWQLGARNGLQMIGPYFYSGQGVLVRNADNIRTVWNLQNAKVCVIAGSSYELRMRRVLKRLRYATQFVLYEDEGEMFRGFEEEKCNVMTSDATNLLNWRRKLRDPEATKLLPQLLSKNPFGLIVSNTDREWPLLVDLLFSGLIYADELGITKQNVMRAEKEGSEDIIAFLNYGTNELFKPLNSDNWVVEVIAQHGSYSEIYNRYFGANTVTPFPEGVHRNWMVGGLVYGQPIF